MRKKVSLVIRNFPLFIPFFSGYINQISKFIHVAVIIIIHGAILSQCFNTVGFF